VQSSLIEGRTARDTALWIAAVLLAAWTTITSAQAPPRCWVLVYAGGPHRPAYAVGDLTHLLAEVDTADHPTGRLCDGVLFLEYQTVSGRNYVPVPNGIPSTDDDWTVYLDSIFVPRGAIARVDSAAGIVGQATGTPNHVVAVAVMVPYPDPRADSLRFGGHWFMLHSDSSRVALATQYIREVRRRFATLRLAHVSLTHFYWMYEGIANTDTAVVSRVAREVHAEGLRFLWIPSYRAVGWDRWKAMGFDQAWLQPNYFFNPDVPTTRFDSALTMARSAAMGLELEMDRRMFDSWHFADRLEPYLSMFENAPDMRQRPIAIYDGGGALIQLARARDPWHHCLYERLVTILRASNGP
jgi:Domain of unknown function (DUF4855)